jgi:hypothetical protein
MNWQTVVLAVDRLAMMMLMLLLLLLILATTQVGSFVFLGDRKQPAVSHVTPPLELCGRWPAGFA